ncbi:unnamed protein product [Arabis nemorensis]|uniref:Uncharacterized protein n=1 Tax=Arabis nemorensis TaxID=586526 RepID=A0A565BIW9_9BRAS|nr:unnamed protein product [Arabis nemorensis]
MIESIQVIGFLFLLEQNHYARNLISSLVSLPDAFIDAVANQTLVCLSLLFYKDYYSSMFVGANNNNNNYDQSLIPLIIRVTGGRLSLNVINQNRKSLLDGLTIILNDVCDPAFEDLCARAERYNKEKILALEREKAIENLKKIRRFGEVIEEIVMQEVEENEQPLYARMVLKMCYVSKMEQIVRRRSRNKFTINGKHVWARKYVRKNLTSSASPHISKSLS